MPTGPRPPIPPLAAKVDIAGTILGHQWHNTSYLQVAGSGIGSADMNSIATGIRTAWGAQFKGNLTADVVQTSVRVLYVPAVGQEILGIDTTATAGIAAGSSPTDAAACAVINWNVNRYYRGGHPRWYLPGMASTTITNGSDLAGSIRTSLTADANAFITAVNALTSTNVTSVTLGTLSFQHAGAWRVPPVFWAYVSATVAQKLGTQRRRIHG